MTTVAVTGVGGLLGRRLVGSLERADAVERVRGLDLAAPEGLESPKLDYRHADVRDRDLPAVLEDVDVLVHLAFQMDPIQDEATMWDVNVEGTRNVFQAAAKAGVEKIVYPSSVVAYGAHPDNDFPLTEDSALRGNPDFNYADHKRQIEEWLWPWADEHPDITVTVLRPSLVSGPGVDSAWTKVLVDQPRFTVVKNHRPPLQLVHVDDVVSALDLAVREYLPGAYNVASEGWLSLDEVLAITGQRVVEVPEEVAFSVVERLWRLGLSPAPAGMVHFVMHPWVMSAQKLTQAGWRPQYSNRDALAQLADEHRDVVLLGPRRLSRRVLRRSALAGGGALALLGLAELARRRR